MSEPRSTKASDATDLFDEFYRLRSGKTSLDNEAGERPQLYPFEETWEDWLLTLFPQLVRSGFGPHHRAFWDWVWELRPQIAARPFVGLWPRGGAKSASAELAAVAVGARAVRRYGLYVSGTQELADRHVESIAGILESDAIARYYPALGNRHVSKYGSSRGWRRNRLRTAAGFTVDSVGLDTAVRGIKIEDARPDFLIIDDIDSLQDTPQATEKKIATLTQSILPAASTDVAVLAVQNLIHPDSIFSRLAGKSEFPADFLANRIVSGPFPAILDLETEERDGRAVIVSGTPLWSGQDLAACQHAIDTYGLTAFLCESQQEITRARGMFKRQWWQRYSTFDRALAQQVIQVWDTAFETKQSNDYSVCSTWALLQNRAYVLDVFRGRLEFPELKRKARDLDALWQPDAVVIEKKASGHSLIQELVRETMLPVIGQDVVHDKTARAAAVTAYVETGRVFLPASAPWVHAWIEEHATFPASTHDDQVDTTSIALKRLFARDRLFREEDVSAAEHDGPADDLFA